MCINGDGSQRGRRLAEAARVVLAHEPDFTLGRLKVSPAMRELVRDDGRREVLEHRVMEVLVALARCAGTILTRDELTERCWQGRVVGDDAITRVISLLRRTADGIGSGSFSIETITKVGYRLNADVMPSAAGGRPTPLRDRSRRGGRGRGSGRGRIPLPSSETPGASTRNSCPHGAGGSGTRLYARIAE